jgi:hypothetical protein
LTRTDPSRRSPRGVNEQRTPQRDLPDRIHHGLEGLRDRIGANKAVAATAAVVAVVLLVAIVAAVIASTNGGDEGGGTPAAAETSSAATEDQAAPTLPADGAYLARQEATGLCVTNGPEPGNPERSVMVLGDCAATYPAGLAFASQGAGVYTVGLDFAADAWQACWGADEPADEAGYLTAGQDCADTDLQRFELTGVGADSYTIAVVASGLCLGLLEDAAAEAGAALATAPCDPDDPTQRFALLVP